MSWKWVRALMEVLLDINEDILSEAKLKFAREEVRVGHSFVQSSAEDLGAFPEGHFDVYMISFGLRNVPNVQKSLEEAYRVLKPGGRYLCLEFAKVSNPALNWAYQAYSKHVIPRIGQVVAQDQESYAYLVESIERFYGQQEMMQKLERAGFERVTATDLSSGICALYSGFKL